jgi:serine/threonine protein kinase
MLYSAPVTFLFCSDLKPENVLLKGEPTSPIGMAAKVTDFGLCAAIQPNQTRELMGS